MENKTAEEILRDTFIVYIREDKPDWTEEERVKNLDDSMAREPLFKRAILAAMNDYASQQSKIAVNKAIQEAIDLLKVNSWFDIFGTRSNNEITHKLEQLKQ